MSSLTNVELIIDFLENKRWRQNICRNYIEENPLMTEFIIDYWNLERVD